MKNLKSLRALVIVLTLSGSSQAIAQSTKEPTKPEAETTYAPIQEGGAHLNPPPPNVVSLKESVKADLKLYPNPSSGNFQIETNLRGEHKLMILDLAGNVHLQKEVLVNQDGIIRVDLNNAARGLYLVNLGNTTLKFQKV